MSNQSSGISNLSSGLFGVLIGAIIGVGGTFLGVYFNVFFDIAVDDEAAKVELMNVNTTITEYLKENDNAIPKYKLLNTDINWKKILIDVNDKEFATMYFTLKNLDTLRELILTNTDKEETRNVYIKEYRKKLTDFYNSTTIDDQINRLIQRTDHRFESN